MEIESRFEGLPERDPRLERLNIVVLTGAGISVESGLKPFRYEDGALWQEYDWRKLSSVEGFKECPEAVMNFYTMRRKRLLEIEPNLAHFLLSELEKWHNVTIITQNVDNLHERAGSSNVIHMHGELTKVTSSADKENPNYIKELPLDIPLKVGDKAADGSQLRPYVVWFGEKVVAYPKLVNIIRGADIFLVIGTSLTVQPAADLVRYARRDIPRFIINPGQPFDPYDDHFPEGFEHIEEAACEGMEIFIVKLIQIAGM